MVMNGFSPYGPSKAALEAAAVIWAKDLAGTDVTVNTLLPGGPGRSPRPVHMGAPEVMAAPIRWLSSTASDGVTGRHFIAKAWDSAPPLAEAAKKARASEG